MSLFARFVNSMVEMIINQRIEAGIALMAQGGF